MMPVLVVESPAKAKTINSYLGSSYTVIASYGHVRDLPSKNGSVDPQNDLVIVCRWIRGGAFTDVVHTVLDAMGAVATNN